MRALALHPGVADGRVWAPLQEALGDRVVLDAPDHLPMTLEALVPEVPTWLIGGSIGGRRALELTKLAPDSVAGLVLLAPSIASEEVEVDLEPAERALGDAIDAAWEARDLDACNRLECHLWLDGATAAEGRVGGAARELFLDMNGRLLAADVPDPPRAPLPDPASLDIPVLVIVGSLDLRHYQHLAVELASEAPFGELVVLEDTAHLPMLERPAEVARYVLERLGLAPA